VAVTDKIRLRIENEEDFIYYPRLNNSLKLLIQKNPDGLDNDKIAKALMISEKEVEDIFQSAVNKIRDCINIK
jgi:hypothetical protein